MELGKNLLAEKTIEKIEKRILCEENIANKILCEENITNKILTEQTINNITQNITVDKEPIVDITLENEVARINLSGLCEKLEQDKLYTLNLDFSGVESSSVLSTTTTFTKIYFGTGECSYISSKYSDTTYPITNLTVFRFYKKHNTDTYYVIGVYLGLNSDNKYDVLPLFGELKNSSNNTDKQFIEIGNSNTKFKVGTRLIIKEV